MRALINDCTVLCSWPRFHLVLIFYCLAPYCCVSAATVRLRWLSELCCGRGRTLQCVYFFRHRTLSPHQRSLHQDQLRQLTGAFLFSTIDAKLVKSLFYIYTRFAVISHCDTRKLHLIHDSGPIERDGVRSCEIRVCAFAELWGGQCVSSRRSTTQVEKLDIVPEERGQEK